MESPPTTSCPVCTLYLRPGITLKDHLDSHPKLKVIEALCRLSDPPAPQLQVAKPQPWPPGLINLPHGNHVFIYQQSVSTGAPAQYVVPPVLPPYVYQQQQFIVAGGAGRPFELPECTITEELVEEKLDVDEKIEDAGGLESEEVEESDLAVDTKACQTHSREPSPEKFYETYQSAEFQATYEQQQFQNGAEQYDYVEMDGMQVVINDFAPGPIISQVENFESSSIDRSSVLMTIGGMEADESRESTSNVNIRSDERMPPRGELSGQESVSSSSDMTWHRVTYDAPVMSTSYDLLARESWDASNDSSDIELCSKPASLNVSASSSNVSAGSSNVSGVVEFGEIDTIATSSSNVRSDRPSVKKLTVKLKSNLDLLPPPPKDFDNVFTNKLKVEPQLEAELIDEPAKIKIDQDEQPVEVKVFCTICDSVLANAKELKEHKQTVHHVTSVRHKCTTCDEQFPNDYKFSEHLRIHPLECKICGRSFYRRQNMQLHMRRHLGIKPYKCDVCDKAFLTKQKLDEHRNVHTGDAPIKCNLCDQTFRRHSNLVQHRNRHHLNLKKKLKDYICACKEVFHSKKKLAWHMETHDSKPKSCTQCNEKFVHMSSLTRHMRRAHNHAFLPNSSKAAENVTCPICSHVVLKSSLETHIKNHSGRRPFTCLICNKDFTTKWNLKLHKWTHASRVSKPFKCDQCKGAFIRESDYTAHMNSHKSVRPYTCNYCGAQFIRKYNCQRHVKEHENDKSYACKVCGKNFHRSYYLKDHMRIHSGVRPFSCHICGKTSTTKSNHNKHVQIHHAREPVSTEN